MASSQSLLSRRGLLSAPLLAVISIARNMSPFGTRTHEGRRARMADAHNNDCLSDEFLGLIQAHAVAWTDIPQRSGLLDTLVSAGLPHRDAAEQLDDALDEEQRLLLAFCRLVPTNIFELREKADYLLPFARDHSFEQDHVIALLQSLAGTGHSSAGERLCDASPVLELEA